MKNINIANKYEHWKHIEKFINNPDDEQLKQNIILNLKRQQGLTKKYNEIE